MVMIALVMALSVPTQPYVPETGGQFAMVAPPGARPVIVAANLVQAAPDPLTAPESAVSAQIPAEAVPPAVAGPPAVAEPASAPAPQMAPEGAPPAAAPAEDVVLQRDPWEKANRSIFAGNEAVDHAVLGPIAHVYVAIVPRFLRDRISSILLNLDEPLVAINDLLQGHLDRFGQSTARFITNSTVGLGGMFDVAAANHLPRRDADFGQTLGRWGLKPGPYVMLPLLGPSNLRDSVGRVVDFAADPPGWLFGGFLSTFGASRISARTVTARVAADPAIKAMRDATDPYATARSAYAQARAATVRETTGKTETLPDFGAP